MPGGKQGHRQSGACVTSAFASVMHGNPLLYIFGIPRVECAISALHKINIVAHGSAGNICRWRYLPILKRKRHVESTLGAVSASSFGTEAIRCPLQAPTVPFACAVVAVYSFAMPHDAWQEESVLMTETTQ